MLMPKKLKHRRQHRGRLGGLAQRTNKIDFGEFGLKSLTRGWLTSRQIEAARRAATRYIKRGGQLWIRVFPDRPMTKQPAETRMGGGKGSLDHFVVAVRPGQIVFELSGVPREIALEAFRLAGHKLPVKTRLVTEELQ